jgi:hypothetical protein
MVNAINELDNNISNASENWLLIKTDKIINQYSFFWNKDLYIIYNFFKCIIFK